MTSRNPLLQRLCGLSMLASFAVGCSGEQLAQSAEPVTAGCVLDLDGDGYGVGCPAGKDCNDSNASVHQGCSSCEGPAEGCSCEPGTPGIECVDHGLADSDTLLCKVGTRYCRDGKWSSCESISQFELDVGPSSSIGQHVQGLVTAGSQPCDPCSPSCFPIRDPLDPAQGPLADGGVSYRDYGSGITLGSTTQGTEILISPSAACAQGDASVDMDCDSIPDGYELAANRQSKPAGTTPGSVFLTLAPGQAGLASVQMPFVLRSADLHFLFDATTETRSDNGTAGDSSDDYNVVQRLIASLAANPSTPGASFLSGSVSCVDRDRDGVPDARADGLLGDLACLVRDLGFGVGFTREVPFEGPVNNIYYGHDAVQDATCSFSEFLFGQTSAVSTDTSNLAVHLGAIRFLENFGGPNGQSQGLWLTATGQALYVGHDRPALPDAKCPAGTFGYPCFRSGALPIVVLFTGSGLYNGPEMDRDGVPIGNLGTDATRDVYPVEYPLALHDGLVHRGSYAGYLELDATNEDFSSATHTSTLILPQSGTPVGDMGDNLLTFTGDTSGMRSDVDPRLLGCDALVTAQGADAVFAFSLSGYEPSFRVSSEGTRFPSVVSVIRASEDLPPTITDIDLSQLGTSGGDANTAYDLQRLPAGVNAVIQGHLSTSAQFPPDLLDCYTEANAAQCGQAGRASDYARDAVIKFNLEKDMRLWFQSVKQGWSSSLTLYESKPGGVVDLNVLDPSTGKPREVFYLPGGASDAEPGPLNGNSYRLVGNTDSSGCNGFDIKGLAADHTNATVRYGSAPDTDPSTLVDHCNLSGLTDPVSDFEVQFQITQDGTAVVFDTAGDESRLEASDDILLALRKLDPAVTDPPVQVCELNNYDGFEMSYVLLGTVRRTHLAQTLDAGTYSLLVRSVDGSAPTSSLRLVMRDASVQPNVMGCQDNQDPTLGGARSYFDYRFPPLSACRLGYVASNGCKDANGVSHYQDYYLVLRPFLASDVSDDSFTIYIRDIDESTPSNVCTSLSANHHTFTGSLESGDYYAVIKGVGPNDNGQYQLTLGDSTRAHSNGSLDAKLYEGAGGVLEALNQQGIYVIPLQDGTDGIVKRQLDKLAWDTGAKDSRDNPVVMQLSDATADGSSIFSLGDVGYALTHAIQEVAGALRMDVTVELDGSTANPGFTLGVQAVGSEPRCNGSISADGSTWKRCSAGAQPNFEVSFQNPAAAPVGPNDENHDGVAGRPDNPADLGGYNLTLNLVGKAQIGVDATLQPVYRSYVLEQIPVRILPADLGFVGGRRFYYASGTYTQLFESKSCIADEAPDWSRLSWTADLPSDTALEFHVCTATEQTDLSACQTTLAARTWSGNACGSDLDCSGGYCHAPSGLCRYIQGPTCAAPADCGERGNCVMGVCTWPDVPVDMGAALKGGGIGGRFMRMDVILQSSADLRATPTLGDWRLDYECVAAE